MNTQAKSHLRSIFLAVDGSEDSIAAARLISELPLEEQCQVTVLSVLTAMQTPGLSILLEAQKQATTILERAGINHITGILHGHPAKELVSFAQEQNPDLLVVGAKGLRATLDIFLGGIAQQVAEYAEESVLIVRSPYEGLQRVLLTIDGSEPSQRAVAYLANLPLLQDTRVDILHVLSPMPMELKQVAATGMRTNIGDLEQEHVNSQRSIEEEEQAGRELLHQAKQQFKNSGWQVETYLFRGDAAADALSHIQEHDIDLVVAGSRGLSEIRGWLMGSFSRKMIHYADSSVLIVK